MDNISQAIGSLEKIHSLLIEKAEKIRAIINELKEISSGQLILIKSPTYKSFPQNTAKAKKQKELKEKICCVDGCNKRRYGNTSRCYDHFREQQKTYQRVSTKNASLANPVKKINPPSSEEAQRLIQQAHHNEDIRRIKEKEESELY